MTLTFGDIKKGDYIQCGRNPVIYHVDYIDWFDNGKLQNFRMTDVDGKSKCFAFFTREIEFVNGSIVNGFNKTGVCECCGKVIQ